MEAMEAFIEAIGVFFETVGSFFKDVTEEDIEKNIQFLSGIKWFAVHMES